MSLATYQALERRLIRIRWLRQGCESAEEDAVLDAMDVAWRALTPEEQALTDRAPPRSFIVERRPLALDVDQEDMAAGAWPRRDVEETPA